MDTQEHNVIENPFQTILVELNSVKRMLYALQGTEPAVEIIDRQELMKRLHISEPTVISLVRKKKIPQINLGSSCRYDWNKVLQSLQKCSRKPEYV